MTLICWTFFPAGSLSRGGDDAQPSLSTPDYSVLVSVSVFMVFSTVFHFTNPPDNSPLSRFFSSGLNSASLVLSTVYLFMEVSLGPDIILCGGLGLKHQLNHK